MKRLHLCVIPLGLFIFSACGPNTTSDSPDGSVDPRDSAPEVDVFESDPFVDDDGDGYTEIQGDCADNNPTIHPFAEEICGDGLDNVFVHKVCR